MREKLWWDVYLRKRSGQEFMRRTKDVSAAAAVRNVWFTDVKPHYSPDEMETAKAVRTWMFAKLVLIHAKTKPYRRRRPRNRNQYRLFNF